MKSILNWQRLKGLIQKGALVLPAVGKGIENWGNWEQVANSIGMIYTGFNFKDGTFRWDRLVQGYGPFVASIVATEGVSLLKRVLKGRI